MRQLLRNLLLSLSMLLGTGTLPAAQPASNESLRPREQFALKLHAFATSAQPPGSPAYFAIVRRSLDRYDALASAIADPAAIAPQIDLAQISSAPDDQDQDKLGQYLTRLRLNIREDLGARMIGARPVPDGMLPEVVALTGRSSLCTGIALRPDAVLTAAHCACDLGLHVQHGALADLNKKIHIGGKIQNTDTRSFSIDLTRTAFLSGSTPCGNLVPSLLSGKPDLAIIRTANGQPMPITGATLGSATLLQASVGTARTAFLIMGFGCSRPRQPEGRFVGCAPQHAGQKLQGAIVDSFHCAQGLPARFGAAGSFCVPGSREIVLADLRSQSPVDTCGGDSGGPVFLIVSESGRTRLHLVAIASRALDPNGVCGKGGIYGKIATAEVRTWIERTLDGQ